MTGASPLYGNAMARKTVGTDLMSRMIAVSTIVFYFLATNAIYCVCTTSYLI